MTAITSTFRVGDKFLCTVSVPLNQPPGSAITINAEWHPRPPSRLTDDELAEYRAGRNAVLTEVARHLGGNVAVVDL